MNRLGDKNRARSLAREANVPVVPGSDGLVEDEAAATKVAHQIGFPVLIKATAGGGGKGMRVASNDLALKSALSQASGGAGRLRQRGRLPGKVRRTAAPRRSADHRRPPRQRGPPVGTRLLHAAPPPEADRGEPGPQPARKGPLAICEAAVRLIKKPTTPTPARWSSSSIRPQLLLHRGQRAHSGRASGDRDGHRHRPDQGPDPGRFRRAAPVRQESIVRSRAWRSSAASTRRTRRRISSPVRGHSAAHHARRLRCALGLARASGLRCPPYYDSMIGKLIVHQPTRAEAIACMQRALSELRIEGIHTTARSTVRSWRTRTSSKAGSTPASWNERSLVRPADAA
jgi:acetyl-CoA carboxylase, biotin carboxylase subunit